MKRSQYSGDLLGTSPAFGINMNPRTKLLLSVMCLIIRHFDRGTDKFQDHDLPHRRRAEGAAASPTSLLSWKFGGRFPSRALPLSLMWRAIWKSPDAC